MSEILKTEQREYDISEGVDRFVRVRACCRPKGGPNTFVELEASPYESYDGLCIEVRRPLPTVEHDILFLMISED